MASLVMSRPAISSPTTLAFETFDLNIFFNLDKELFELLLFFDFPKDPNLILDNFFIFKLWQIKTVIYG